MPTMKEIAGWLREAKELADECCGDLYIQHYGEEAFAEKLALIEKRADQVEQTGQIIEKLTAALEDAIWYVQHNYEPYPDWFFDMKKLIEESTALTGRTPDQSTALDD